MNEETELRRRAVLRMSNEESHQLTLECIRTALLYLMAQKPYDKITITDIINRSGVSRAAFYRNYSTKDDVLQDAMRELTEQLETAFSSSLAETDPERWMIETLRGIKKKRDEMEMIIKARLNVEEIFNNMKFAGDAGDPFCRYKNVAYVHALWAMIIMWIETGFREEPEDLGKYMVSIFAKNT